MKTNTPIIGKTYLFLLLMLFKSFFNIIYNLNKNRSFEFFVLLLIRGPICKIKTESPNADPTHHKMKF